MSLKKADFLLLPVLLTEVGLWFLLNPETFWQRASTVLFGVVLLVFLFTVAYFYGKRKDDPEVNE